MKVLAGKTAIVTGASRGIGRAIAIHLAREGANVLLTARDTALLGSAVKEILDAGGQAPTFAADLREPEAAPAVVRAAIEAYAGIDILINSAGATKRGEFEELGESD